MFTKPQILEAARKLKINLKVVPYKTLKTGLKVELEHGISTHNGDAIAKKTNITNDDIIMTIKIVLAHLREGLTYYDLLEKLESKLEKIRKKTGEPSLFLDT